MLVDFESETSMRKPELVATHAGYNGGYGSLFFSLLTPSTTRSNVGVGVAGDIYAIQCPVLYQTESCELRDAHDEKQAHDTRKPDME